MKSSRKLTSVGVFGAGLLSGLAFAGLLYAQAGGGYATKMIFRGDLQNLPGQEVMVFSSDWNPGFRLPLHKHPNGHEWTYVVEGEQLFFIQGVGEKVIKAGEIVYTPPDTPHFGRNATDKPSKTIVFRIKDKDQPIMVEVKP